MTRQINLADPDDEPTDEELAGLMKRAFAGLDAARAQSLEDMRARIAAAQRAAAASLEPSGAGGGH